MLFSEFSAYLDRLESISSRLEITAILAKIFGALKPDEIDAASCLLQGELRPAYENIELQLAVKTVLKALAQLRGDANTSEIEKLYKHKGDAGLVAAEVMTQASEGKGGANLFVETHTLVAKKAVTIHFVYDALLQIANEHGADSQQRKLTQLVELLQPLDPVSAKFVVRIILGRLRLGFSDMTMIDALSWTMTGNKSERDALENAYQKKADIGKLAAVYLGHTDAAERQKMLAKYSVEVGVPVIPALCQRLNTTQEMIDKMHDVIAEPKYDGMRVQLHYQAGKHGQPPLLRTFTRNLEETTHMFPELVKAVEKLKCDSCILDGEVIGYDPDSGELLPFQQTIQRKRKHDIDTIAGEIPVRFYWFDILAENGNDLLQLPLTDRKALLDKVFTDSAVFVHSPVFRTSDPAALHKYHEQQLAMGLEGAVIKQATSVYQSGRKGWSWVKIKEAEGTSGKLADTLDLVVMGYYLGRGKRTEFGIGAILVGILDENDHLKTIAKIGTGLSDEQLRQTKHKCDLLKTNEQPSLYHVPAALKPDVWCQPGFVMEIAADELTTSPLHSAGVALRFPRLITFREDKTWQQATKMSELKGMQATVKFFQAPEKAD